MKGEIEGKRESGERPACTVLIYLEIKPVSNLSKPRLHSRHGGIAVWLHFSIMIS